MPGLARLALRSRAQTRLASLPSSIRPALVAARPPSQLAVPTPQTRLASSSSKVVPPRSKKQTMATDQRDGRSFATAIPGSAANGAATSPLDSLPLGFEIRTPSSSSTTSSSSSSDAPSAPYALFTKDLERSLLDDRQYRIICLANGLEALVIHDPTADKGSAAMDVRVGHLSDPKDFQGLAHFCEHLLFMGTEKYPRENEYSEFLSNHSGSSNAYTGMDNTNYFFAVGQQHLEGALDRFSKFFICPLFDASCTEREIRAVDSEHKKNLQSDAWRAFQLEKSLSDPAHPYSHFGTGSAQTLWDEPRARGQDVRDELLKFHDRYYSANVMKLVVLGRESLDQLTEWVVDKFSAVRNKGLAAPTFPTSPLGKEQLATQVFFKTVKDIRSLDLTFPIPDQNAHFRSKPGQFLSHFIGHEGQGSILSHLKQQGWANLLSAGSTNGADGFEFFKISIDLTKEGFKNYEKVVAAIFQYIDILKQADIPEWAYQEVSSLCDLAFRFREKIPPSSYTSGLSSQMQLPFPREWVLSGPFLTREFDHDLIKQTLACLSPEKCRISVAAQECPDGTQAWDQKEKWYGTEYKLSPLPAEILSKQASDAADLALPKPNNFIPQSFDVEKVKVRPSKRPVLLRDTPTGRLWHKKDDQFFLPKANVFMLLRSPLIDATPANAVKSRIFVELLKDAMTEYAYDAELAGLGYNIEASQDGLSISVDGYNDKLPVLLKYILKAVKDFQIDSTRFEMVKDMVVRMYENFRLEAPYQHANYYTTYLTTEVMWTPEEKLKELHHLSPEDVERYIPDLLARLHVELLAHGNISETESTSLMDTVESTLSAQPLSPAELISPRSLILPTPANIRWRTQVSNPANVNSAIEVYCQVGDPMDVQLRSTLGLMSQIASEPVFDVLRTKEQLGYLVFSSVRKTIGSLGYRIIIQSERSAAYLESRIETFFDHFKGILEAMTAEEFEKHKSSLIAKKKEQVKNLVEESSRFWFHIHSGYYDFLQRDRDIDALASVSKEDVIALFMKHIHPSSPTRSKLSVHLQSQVKVKPTVFSKEAAEEMKKRMESQAGGPSPPAEAWEMLLKGQTSVDQVKEFVGQTLKAVGADKATVDGVLSMVDELAKAFPTKVDATPSSEGAAPEEENKEEALLAQATEINEISKLKADLVPSKASYPVRSLEEYKGEPERREEETDGSGATKANL